MCGKCEATTGGVFVSAKVAGYQTTMLKVKLYRVIPNSLFVLGVKFGNTVGRKIVTYDSKPVYDTSYRNRSMNTGKETDAISSAVTHTLRNKMEKSH
jgi:hypothetical protein